ncbi:MAG: HAD hydrolase-like protein [Alphaproteobacteria bacterium]|nr:HAD hydrolase-like protein [Alphaproteobacteria bacterium]
MPPKPRAVIFDWDDTLVDTWQVIRNALNVTLKAMGREPWTEEEARNRIGPPAKVLFSGLFGEDRWQEADAIYIKAYVDGITDHLATHPHVTEILDLLHGNGVQLFVVSSKRGPILRREMAHLSFDRYFESVVGAGDAPADKPHAEAVMFALDGSGVEPGPDVWFIGDGLTDMKSAHNAGCLPILVETKLPGEEGLMQAPPAFRLKTHADLLAFVKEHMNAGQGRAPEADAVKSASPKAR